MPLDALPPELYAAIIDQFDELDLQKSALALTRAIPYSPVPRHPLFHSLRITNTDQIVRLYQRIRPRTPEHEGEEASWIKSFSLETWIADAEIVLKLLALLTNLHTLTIWIGPKNFTPEHLEELFSVDRKGRCLSCTESLRYLSLRFRPYVQKATYQQFLSGSYFDPMLDALSRWPSGHIPALSIVQDPLTNESGNSEGSEVPPPPTFSLGLPQRTLAAGFAQPIVFFKLEATLPALLRSPSIRIPLKSLRLRFPSRNPTRSLTEAPLPQPPSYGASVLAGSLHSIPDKYLHRSVYTNLTPAPYLKFLDLSTCLIPEASLPQILVRYPSLTHLVLDDCGLLRNGDVAIRDNGREWGILAKNCVLAGPSKARAREKKVEEWVEKIRGLPTPKTTGSRKKFAQGSASVKSEAAEDDRKQGKQKRSSKAKTRRGKDLAGATDSVVKGTTTEKRTRGRKGLASATLSLRKDSTATSESLPRPNQSSLRQFHAFFTPGELERIRILPPLPTLRHLTATLHVPHSVVIQSPSVVPVATTSNSMDVAQTQHLLPSLFLHNIQREWERGWAEGVSQLVKARERLRASWRNKLVRVMRFAAPGEMPPKPVRRSKTRRRSNSDDSTSRSSSHALSGASSASSDDSAVDSRNGEYHSSDSEDSETEEGEFSEEGFSGLVEILHDSEFDVNVTEVAATPTSASTTTVSSAIPGVGRAPMLCLGGHLDVVAEQPQSLLETTTPSQVPVQLQTVEGNTGTVAIRRLPHTAGCAHEVGRGLWADRLP